MALSEQVVIISIHAPLAGCDKWDVLAGTIDLTISIHAPLAGCDMFDNCWKSSVPEFQSTRPLRGATKSSGPSRSRWTISIHAPLAGRDDGKISPEQYRDFISIHAPLAGRDLVLQLRHRLARVISIHAPLAGRDYNTGRTYALGAGFQSTRPLRGATQTAPTF